MDPLWTQSCPTCRRFPAHAGMDPDLGVPLEGGERFPRPRGDGPLIEITIADGVEVSPPTRGWTRRRCRWPTTSTGFPAHAGMDHVITATRERARFPRPRGDGPQQADDQGLRQPVSPPTRGWTRGISTSSSSMTVSPPTRDGPGLGSGMVGAPGVSPPTRGWTSSRRLAVA